MLECAAFGVWSHKTESLWDNRFNLMLTFPSTCIILSFVLVFLTGTIVACNLKQQEEGEGECFSSFFFITVRT